MTEPRVALVTAGSRGIGGAITRALHVAGYRVVVMSTSDAADRIAEEIGGIGVRGSTADPDALDALVATALKAYGRIDAVVNNTGHAAKGSLLGLTDREWHEGLDLLLLSAVRMARLVTPHMLERGRGVLINVSTFGAVEPDAAFPISSALRAGLAGFVKMYATEHAARGVRMNSVLPGFVDSHPERPEFVERIPTDRYGTVEEIAAVVRFLCSDEAAYITGQSIRVDGGLTRSI